jgi:hypothetical protein
MKTLIYNISICLLLLFLAISCKKEEVLPLNTAKGKIIAVTEKCYGEIVLIEIENPKGIGFSSTFSTIDKEIEISYKNAIGVPYFDKIGLSGIASPMIGASLYFEYRELTNDELNDPFLFSPNPPIICQGVYGSPTCKRLIITKIY